MLHIPVYSIRCACLSRNIAHFHVYDKSEQQKETFTIQQFPYSVKDFAAEFNLFIDRPRLFPSLRWVLGRPLFPIYGDFGRRRGKKEACMGTNGTDPPPPPSFFGQARLATAIISLILRPPQPNPFSNFYAP